MENLKEKEIWLSASEIANLSLNTLPHTRAAVSKWAKAGNWEKRARRGKGAGFVYSLYSLPEDARNEIKSNPLLVERLSNLTEFGMTRMRNKSIGLNTIYKSDFSLSPEEKKVAVECSHRLVGEEYRLGIERADLAFKLGMPLEELVKYELAEKSLNALILQKLKGLGFDVWFILFGERIKN